MGFASAAVPLAPAQVGKEPMAGFDTCTQEFLAFADPDKPPHALCRHKYARPPQIRSENIFDEILTQSVYTTIAQVSASRCCVIKPGVFYAGSPSSLDSTVYTQGPMLCSELSGLRLSGAHRYVTPFIDPLPT